MATCLSGHEVAPDAPFCAACGAPLRARCGNGHLNPIDSRFCGTCGIDLFPSPPVPPATASPLSTDAVPTTLSASTAVSAPAAVARTGPLLQPHGQMTGGFGSPSTYGRPSYWPTLIVSLLFGIFGLIPARRHSRMARERGYPTKGYWWSFWLAWLGPYLLATLLVGLLVLLDRGTSSVPTRSTLPTKNPGAGIVVVGLQVATHNTLSAPSFTENLSEDTPQGKQTDHLVYQAPGRLGGYSQAGSKRTYVYIIGNVEYQSGAGPSNASTHHLLLYRQQSQGASAVDPAHNYLQYAAEATHVHTSGNTYTFKLRQSGQTGTFTYTVKGQYIAALTLTTKNSNVDLALSKVGTSPPVMLPSGSTSRSAPSPSG
jgi:hypothetical protein